jgi:hypothetical protein
MVQPGHPPSTLNQQYSLAGPLDLLCVQNYNCVVLGGVLLAASKQMHVAETSSALPVPFLYVMSADFFLDICLSTATDPKPPATAPTCELCSLLHQ